jgi:hypothetical protein
MTLAVPTVEFPEHGYRFRIRGPHREVHTCDALHRDPVGPEALIEASMGPFLEKIDVLRRQETRLIDGTFRTAES